jgi:tetratricopeptide (TPR) repeat protein
VPPPSPGVPAQLFYSYSHKDEKLRDQLETHLSTLKRENRISGWHDRRITAGTEWKGEIDEHLKSSSVILLLVTANFLASDYCHDVELRYAMQQHEQGNARIVPVILRPCDWKTAIFAKLQALPTDGKPVVSWKDRDDAFLNVVEGIRKALVDMPAANSFHSVEWVVEIKAQLGSLDPSTIEKIVDFLRDQTGDAHLTLRRVEKGSVRLVLEGSGDGVTRILDLYKKGLLKTIMGFEVSAITTLHELTHPLAAAISVPVLNALHQLPAPPADFTGRADELKELLAAVKTGGVTISGLQGLGGVGKTALALKLAERLKPDYPDAQFYLDLKGVTQPLSPRDAMAYVIRAYYPTAQVSEKEEEVAALYRSVLDGKRALLVMDNARDAQQVAPLVPPSRCLLIVTSRKHFGLPGLVEKNLDKLPADDARDLLLRVAPRLRKEKPEQVEELARLCGYLPLALRAVGSALHEKKNISPADYANRLKETSKYLVLKEIDPSIQKSVGAALQSSYDLLSDDLPQKFRFLAVFPDTFDQAAAAAVWDVPPESSQDPLGELLAYSLVEFDEITNRYSLHDLVRLFASQLLKDEERYNAQKRHAGHYLDVMHAANTLYEKGGDAVTKGLALFDLEVTNIRVGHDWVVGHQEDDNSIAEWCWRYPHAGVYCLSLRQHPRESIRWLERALSAARRLKQQNWEGVALGNLGNAYEDLAEYRRAIEYHEQVLQISRELGNRRDEGRTLGNLGNAYYKLGEYHRAIEYQERRLKIAREIGDRLGEGNALGNLGIAYYSLGEYPRAIQYQEQRLKIVREIGDRLGESQALGNLGIAYKNLGEYRRAIEYHEQALTIDKALGDRRGQGQDLGNLGVVYKNLGEYRRAIEYHEQYLGIAREIGDRLGEANALFNSALSLAGLGDRAAAIARVEDALKIYEAIESPAASKVRDLLAKWREGDTASDQGNVE